jgi:regulator of nonsense transcripts 3
MTEEEFVAILGDEWKVGGGKVGWFSYWPGKVSQQ